MPKRQAEEMEKRAVRNFDDFFESRRCIPQEGKRLSEGEKKSAKRMASVATVCDTETFERTAEDVVAETGCKIGKVKRPHRSKNGYWPVFKKTPEEVIAEAFEEASHRDPNNEKDWVALVDGNNTRIRILSRMPRDKEVKLTIIVDIIHVIEYLWDAGRAFHPESGPELENRVQHRLLGALQGKADLMAAGMGRSAT